MRTTKGVDARTCILRLLSARPKLEASIVRSLERGGLTRADAERALEAVFRDRLATIETKFHGGGKSGLARQAPQDRVVLTPRGRAALEQGNG